MEATFKNSEQKRLALESYCDDESDYEGVPQGVPVKWNAIVSLDKS